MTEPIKVFHNSFFHVEPDNNLLKFNYMEGLKNVSPEEANRIKKRQHIAFRRLMTGEAPSTSMASLIGCGRAFLREYISSKMVAGIHWNNYGSEWVIDHIVPLRLFDLKCDADLSLAWNYRNLMPLFKRDNLIKEGDVRLSLILLDKIDDGSSIIKSLRARAFAEIEKMKIYISDDLVIKTRGITLPADQPTNEELQSLRKRMPRGKRKTTCKCGKPARAGQRDCLDCHAESMRKNRHTKSINNERNNPIPGSICPQDHQTSQ